MICDNCGEEIPKQDEEIFNDFPPNSGRNLCQKCYDEYLSSLANPSS